MSVAPPSAAPAANPNARRKLGHFDNRELSTLAVLATIHFGASLAAVLFGSVLFALFGPFYVFISGLGDEMVPSLLLAAAIVLVPRFGTASLSIVTVWLLNVLVTGTLGLASLLLISTSLAIYEIVLAVAGVSLDRRLREPSSRPPPGLVLRTALALGTANALTYYAQFLISIGLYKLQFAAWYVHTVSLVTGLGYGTLGAAIGVIWGFRLRRAAS